MKIGRVNSIIYLLGAGASADAGVPTSTGMIDEIESNIANDNRWKVHTQLYYHIKSSIRYAKDIKGPSGKDINYNIEVLVNTLNELERNEEHPLYPFIATWNFRFFELAGKNFDKVRDFRYLILDALKRWVCPEDTDLGSYYEGFIRLQRESNFPLSIFSLNYDLFIENLKDVGGKDFRVESGFPGYGLKNPWHWERFSGRGIESDPRITLYKLHGSINWRRNKSDGKLVQAANIDAEEMEIIFGKDFKFDAADPYLFYMSQFRDYALMADLIVIIGYGFGDSHVNKILAQALQEDENRRIFVVEPSEDKKSRLAEIKDKMGVGDEQIIIEPQKAKEFLERENLMQYLVEKIRRDTRIPF